jgi:transposase
VEDWALIRQLYRSEGLSQSAIARQLGLSRNTVAKAVGSDAPPRYERARPAASGWAQAEPAVRQLLVRFPSMPSTVIAERVGWSGGRSWFAENVARIRPEYTPADPCDRLVHHPGEQVQCDLWFPGQLVPDQAGVLRSFPVLVMVAAYSRFISAVMIPSRITGDLLAGMWLLLSEQIGAVPRTLLWDNESGIGQRRKLATGVSGFCGTLGTRMIQARPYDPETKGVVERANGYLETSFLPGRTFTSPADFNTQVQQWLMLANARVHRTTKKRPAEELLIDRRAMAALPPIVPATGTCTATRLGRDYYVQIAGSVYSVNPEVIGRMVTVTAGLDQVIAHCSGRMVAEHQRHWGPNGLTTDPDHVTIAKAQREHYNSRPPISGGVEVQVADLTAYDRAFGTGEVA